MERQMHKQIMLTNKQHFSATIVTTSTNQSQLENKANPLALAKYESHFCTVNLVLTRLN